MSAKVILIAAIAYLAIVFTIAFALGIVRVTLIVPAVGVLAATAIEVPIILAVSWVACKTVVTWRRVSRAAPHRIAMGLIAFALLIALETALGAFAFGRSLADQLSAYSQPAGLLGLAGQVAFAAIPWFQARLARSGP